MLATFLTVLLAADVAPAQGSERRNAPWAGKEDALTAGPGRAVLAEAVQSCSNHLPNFLAAFFGS